MKKITLLLLSLLSPLAAQMAPQPLPQVEHLQGQNYLFSWEGVPGRVYFIQTSSSLTASEFDWEFAPDIRVGTGSQIEMGFQATASHFEFFRLVYSDYSGGISADLADFDNDGYTNLEEAIANTDPYDAQSYPGSGGNSGGGGGNSETTWNHPWEYTLIQNVEGSTISEDVINPYNKVGEYEYDLEMGYHTELIFNSNDDDISITFLRLELNRTSNEWEFKGAVELSNQNPLWSHDGEPQGTIPDGRLIPVTIEVRRPAEGKWISTQELRVAKWKNAWAGGNFRNDFIDTFTGEEIDRFRIRIDTQDLPADLTKIFLSTINGYDEDYDDDPTEISLVLDVNPYGPSEGFISKPIIVVADSTDNKFKNINLLNDQTHIASLGSTVNFRIKEAAGDLIITRAVKKKKTVLVKVKILNHGPDIPAGSAQKALDQMNVAREIFAPSGLEVKYEFSIVDVDQEISYPLLNVLDEVDLSDGLTLNDETIEGELATEAQWILSQLATPNDKTDVVCLIVPTNILFASGGTGGKIAWGFAIADNDEVLPFKADGRLYWDDEVSDLYKGTLLVSLQSLNESTLGHELGHVLTLHHVDHFQDEVDENRNYGPSAIRNFMKNPGKYNYSYKEDFKRFAPFQQSRVLESQFVKDPQ